MSTPETFLMWVGSIAVGAVIITASLAAINWAYIKMMAFASPRETWTATKIMTALVFSKLNGHKFINVLALAKMCRELKESHPYEWSIFLEEINKP